MGKRLSAHLNKQMLATILALAWPTMLQELMQTAVQYIDTAMVGALGTQATAAVGATTTVNWLIGITLSGLSVGFMAYIAKAMGAGEQEKAAEGRWVARSHAPFVGRDLAQPHNGSAVCITCWRL